MLFVNKPYLNLRLLFYVALSVALMFLELHQGSVRAWRASFSIAVAPLQYIVSWPVQMIDQFSANLTSQKVLLAENTQFRAELLLLNAKLQKLLILEQENNKLRALLQSSPRIGEPVSVAQLLAVTVEPFVHQVVLDKGKRDGVFLGQPVIDANGILGQVIEVGSYTSRVLLITDGRFAIPVEDSRNGVRGIVIGTGDTQTLSLINMSQTADVRPGDLLLTSGLGGRFPAGYPVGKVGTVKYDADTDFARITVFPSAQLNQNRLVLLVWIKDDGSIPQGPEGESKTLPAFSTAEN